MGDDPEGLDADIAAYYEGGREQQRLSTISRFEFIRTQELLRRFLPSPPARLLDVGGGAGGHALPLMAAGYAVHLVDPVGLHVEQARAAGVAHASVGDARSLRLGDDSFDAVLLLGPLYHLTDRRDRIAALAEARRVVRPGGAVIVAVISRFASLFSGLVERFLDDATFEAIVDVDLGRGLHVNPDRRPGWFTTAYFHHPSEIPAELDEAGLEPRDVIAVEGAASVLADIDFWFDDDVRRERLLRLVRATEAEPSILGVSSHIVVVGRRH